MLDLRIWNTHLNNNNNSSHSLCFFFLFLILLFGLKTFDKSPETVITDSGITFALYSTASSLKDIFENADNLSIIDFIKETSLQSSLMSVIHILS